MNKGFVLTINVPYPYVEGTLFLDGIPVLAEMELICLEEMIEIMVQTRDQWRAKLEENGDGTGKRD